MLLVENISPRAQETLTLSRTTLELNGPLWDKLNTMFGDERVPKLLSTLAASWDDKTANTLLWVELWHQNTCCGATYASVPHLLKFAEPEENRHQRCVISRSGRARHGPRQGPGDQSEDGEVRALIVGPYAIEPVNASDLEKMRSIMAEFYSALPAIRAQCERALLEYEDAGAAHYLLSGIAAADGLLSIARLLNYRDEGWFTCSSCGWGYSFIRFGERIAVYAEPPRGAPGDDKSLSDFKDGAPSRADGFTTPITDDGVLDDRIAALLTLAKRAPSPEPALLVRHFAGTFLCCKCGVQGPMHSPL
jgi:hypothetical protein